MFQIETPNILFKHLDICSKGCWGQRSPQVIQGHHGSLSLKNETLQYLINFLIFEKPEACNVSL